MSISVDNSGTTPPTSPDPTPAQNDGAGETKEQRRGPRDAADRIQQLVGRAKDAEYALARKAEQVDQLASELAELRTTVNELKSVNGNGAATRTSTKTPMGWSEVASEQLESVLDSDPTENPKQYGMAVREYIRRQKEEGTASAAKASEEALRRQQVFHSTINELQHQYGAEWNDPKFRDVAGRYMGHYVKQRGQNVEQDPEFQRLCASLAYRDLHAQDQEELQTLRRDVERMKQSQALESGRGAARPSDQVRELLKKGRTKDALKQLPIFDDLRS